MAMPQHIPPGLQVVSMHMPQMDMSMGIGSCGPMAGGRQSHRSHPGVPQSMDLQPARHDAHPDIPKNDACDQWTVGTDAYNGAAVCHGVGLLDESLVWNRRRLLHKCIHDPDDLPIISLDDPDSHDEVWIGSRKTLVRLTSPWMSPFWLDRPWDAVKRCAWDAVSTLSFLPAVSPKYLEWHVDGSGCPTPCWTFIVLWERHDGIWHFGGTRFGPIVLSDSSPEYLGATVGDAGPTELSGLVWALLYCLQFSRGGDAPLGWCSLYYDCMVVAHTADVLWKSSGLLSQVATAILNVLYTLVPMSLHHEYNHSGLPYNEFADNMCTLLGRHPDAFASFVDDPPISLLLDFPLAAQCFFALALPPKLACQYPAIELHGHVYLTTGVCPLSDMCWPSDVIASAIDCFQNNQTDASATTVAVSSLPIKMVQVNASTLRVTAKYKLYLRQFRTRRVHMIGFEETRRRAFGIAVDEGYVVAHSPSTEDGSGGVALAVSTTQPFGDVPDDSVVPAKISKDDVNILVVTCRLLLVFISAPSFQTFVMVAHGLDKSYGEAAMCVLHNWKLRRVCKQFTRVVLTLLLLLMATAVSARVGRSG